MVFSGFSDLAKRFLPKVLVGMEWEIEVPRRGNSEARRAEPLRGGGRV